MRRHHHIPWIIAISLLCGCASLTPPINWPSYTYAQRMQRLSHLSQWQWRGGLLLSHTNDQHHVNVYWRYQNPEDYTLNFIAPLGLASARVTVDRNGARLQQSGQPTQTAPSAEALLTHYFGHSWPVHDLAYWVRGMPAPGQSTNITQDQHHHIQTLTQHHWHITYHAYQLVDGYALPAALSISNNQLTLHITINTWVLAHAARTTPHTPVAPSSGSPRQQITP